jgi:hypothetical protein
VEIGGPEEKRVQPDEGEAGLLQRPADLVERRLAYRMRIVAQCEVRNLQPLKAVPGHHLAGLPNIRSSEEPITDCILHAGPAS